jgi:hypothetical protein
MPPDFLQPSSSEMNKIANILIRPWQWCAPTNKLALGIMPYKIALTHAVPNGGRSEEPALPKSHHVYLTTETGWYIYY